MCVDRVLYLFGGHHSRGNTNKVSVSKDYGLRQFYSFSDNFRFLRLPRTPVPVKKYMYVIMVCMCILVFVYQSIFM